MSYKTPEAVKYRNEFSKYVKEEAKKQGWDMIPNSTQHFYIDGIFYFNRTDMDCNNYWKVLLDAITDAKAIWLDDNVVCERVQAIYYDKDNPRIELTIRPVEYTGIFANMHQLEKFSSNCIGCTYYSRNCSILNKAKTGHIQEEVKNCTCLKYKEKKNRKNSAN